MKKILAVFSVFAVLMCSVFAENVTASEDDPFAIEKWEEQKLTTQILNFSLKENCNDIGLKESEIDKNATIKVEYMPMHDELRIYYETLLATYDQGQAMNAVMAYMQKFLKDYKYYQYRYMETDKTKPYKDERKQKKVVYSNHVKLIR